MKKRWYFFIVPAISMLFVIGLWAGTKIGIDDYNRQNSYNSDINGYIAIVNQDNGTEDGISYSNNIIDSLGDEYKSVSYEQAEKGINNGTYAAMVTFPSDFSENVASFNSNKQLSPCVEFLVNPYLTESAYIQTYMKMNDLQNDINKTISLLYVKSIYKEFFAAQDNAKTVMKNDETDIKALEELNSKEFKLDVNWSEIPNIELDLKEINLDRFLEKASDSAYEMTKVFTDSKDLAQQNYDKTQDKLIFDAKNMSDGAKNLAVDINGKVTQYVDDVTDYKEDIEKWEANLQNHNTDLETWKSSIEKYCEDAEAWKKNVDICVSDVNTYLSELKKYEYGVNEYSKELNVYQKELGTYLSDTKKVLDQKINDMKTEVETILDKIEPSITEYNQSVEQNEQYKQQIDKYKNDLFDYYDKIYHAISKCCSAMDELYGQLRIIDDSRTIGLLEYLIVYREELDKYYADLNRYAKNYSKKLDDYYNGKTDTKPDFKFYSVVTHDTCSVVQDFIEENCIPDAISLSEDYQAAKTELTKAMYGFSHPIEVDNGFSYPTKKLQRIDVEALKKDIDQGFEQIHRKANSIVAPKKPAEFTFDSEKIEINLSEVKNFKESIPQFEGQTVEKPKTESPETIKPLDASNIVENSESFVERINNYEIEQHFSDNFVEGLNDIVSNLDSESDGVESESKVINSSNNILLKQANIEYNNSVKEQQKDAEKEVKEENEKLENAMNEFSKIKTETSNSNKKMLNSFSEKMPQSRENQGNAVKKDFAEFTISPLNYKYGEVRTDKLSGTSLQEGRLNTYSLLMVVIMFVLLISTLIIIILYRRDLKKEDEDMLL